MAIDKRATFTKKWFQRALETDDPFDRFIYSWIALVIAAQRLRTRIGNPPGENDTDKDKILDYFQENRDKIFQAIQENQDNMIKLARRRGTNYRNPIVDTGIEKIREKLSKLAAYYTQNCPLSQEHLVEAVGELLNRIRNNLFHGVKVYDDREDIALLKLVNPILLEIIRRCESL